MPGKGALYREVVGWNNGEQEWRGVAIFTAVSRAGLIGKVTPSKALSMGILERCPGRGNTDAKPQCIWAEGTETAWLEGDDAGMG